MDLLVMLMLTFVKTKLDAVSISVEHHRYFPTTLTHFLKSKNGLQGRQKDKSTKILEGLQLTFSRPLQYFIMGCSSPKWPRNMDCKSEHETVSLDDFIIVADIN